MSYAYFVIMMRMTKWRNMAFDKKKTKQNKNSRFENCDQTGLVQCNIIFFHFMEWHKKKM